MTQTFALALVLFAQQRAETITFAKHVAPILQEKCQVCHQPGSIGPMSLLTYQDARPFAPLIKARVQARTMPPWHIDRTVGIQEFKNDRSLSDEQIKTIVAWVDAGAPLGDAKDLPPSTGRTPPSGALPPSLESRTWWSGRRRTR